MTLLSHPTRHLFFTGKRVVAQMASDCSDAELSTVREQLSCACTTDPAAHLAGTLAEITPVSRLGPTNICRTVEGVATGRVGCPGCSGDAAVRDTLIVKLGV